MALDLNEAPEGYEPRLADINDDSICSRCAFFHMPCPESCIEDDRDDGCSVYFIKIDAGALKGCPRAFRELLK